MSQYRQAAFAIGVIFCLLAGMLSTSIVSAEGGAFPAAPFNGMQVTYNFSGATATSTKEAYGFTVSRTIAGNLGTGQLQVSGTAGISWGYGADVAVRVWAGGNAKDFKAKLTTPAQTTFNVAVPIPAGATSGGFSINMTGNYNAGTRGLVITGNLGGAAPPATETVGPAETPYVPSVGLPAGSFCQIEFIEGDGPVYVGTGDPTGPTPWDRNWGRVQTGSKLVWLRPGETVRTGPGVEVRLRWDTGAVTRIHEQALFTPQSITTAQTSQWVMYGRLWEGIVSFYRDKAREDSRQFEFETERANTSIKGTTFDLEETKDATTLTMTEGSVEFRHKITGEVVTVSAGQKVSAVDGGFIWDEQSQPPAAGPPAAGRPSVADNARPTWSDRLSTSAAGLDSVTKQGTKYPGTRDVNFGGDGLAGFPRDTSYAGYAGSRLNAQQGSILVDYYPYYDLVNAYSEDRPAWKKYGQYAPPKQGFIFDTVGWGGAHKGAFELSILPAAGQVMAQAWDGSAWHNIVWDLPPDFSWELGRGYEMGITYGPKGLGLVFDGQVRARLPYTGGIAADQPWFVGQAPWSEPYGPHSLLGTYDNLRVYNQQLGQ